jgi:exonuclease SbcC
MILNQVHLHNFMSYADATLDLTGIPVVCLTGLNGAGKSALLDAVTWAIFEEARASSDDLVRLGEREMWVDVIFAHEGSLYRVRRSRHRSGRAGSSKGSSKGNLEFMVADSAVLDANSSASAQYANIKWNSLTAASMKETGKHILDLLRMDYDTFLNSAYLRQGRSDEFALKPPSERKQVLSEILGLSYFDKLRDEARDRVRFLKAKMDFLSGSVSHGEQLKQKKSTIEEELVVAKREVDDKTAAASDIEERVNELTERVQSLRLIEANISGNEKRLVECRQSLQRLSVDRIELTQKEQGLGALLAESSSIEKDLAEFEAIREKVQKLDHLQLAMQELSERKIALSGELATMRSRLELTCEQRQAEYKETLSKQQDLLKETDGADKVMAQYQEYLQMVKLESELSQKQEAFGQLTRRSQELTAQVQEAKIRLEAEIEQKQRNISDLNVLSGGQDSLDSEGQALSKEAENLDKLEAEFEICESRGMAIKNELANFDLKIEDFKVKQKENLDKIKELEEHAHSSICPLCSAPIVDRAAVCQLYLQQNEEMHQEINRQEAQKENLNIERNQLRVKYIDLKRELAGRKELDKRIGQYNERMRAVDGARQNLSKLTGELAALKQKLLTENYAQLERESLIKIRAELTAIDFDPVVYTSMTSQLRLKRHLEGRKEQLEKDLAELKRVEEKLPQLKETIDTLKAELSSESYGGQLRAQLVEVQSGLNEHSYSREEHSRLKSRLSELFHLAEKSRDVKKAEEELPQIIRKLAEISLEEERNNRLALELEDELKALNAEFVQMDQAKLALSGLTPVLLEMRQQKEEAASKLAVLAEKDCSIEAELALLGERLLEIEALRVELDDFEFLSEALGKKGIQAVIIENAIPEIESEANRILSRLTDNKMHVALITQAKTKSGSMSETLDLVIGDDLGTRNYELYSGGEAFKVNFALRIALSRLLARRAGAKLETLIIDEGFGSQDDASRERLVKAIRLVQQEFSRVLIITHIADVREMFPIQIQVTKVNGVSRLASVS